MALIIYGTANCPDTVDALRLCEELHVGVDYRDICKDIPTMKEFLKLRDSGTAFEEVRRTHRVGVPCVIAEDGTVTLDYETAIRARQ